MLKIINAAPNTKEIFISINIWSADNVSGLLKGLPTMDPTRVVLFDSHHSSSRNKNSQILLGTLTRCIQTEWKNLVLVFPIISPFSRLKYR